MYSRSRHGAAWLLRILSGRNTHTTQHTESLVWFSTLKCIQQSNPLVKARAIIFLNSPLLVCLIIIYKLPNTQQVPVLRFENVQIINSNSVVIFFHPVRFFFRIGRTKWVIFMWIFDISTRLFDCARNPFLHFVKNVEVPQTTFNDGGYVSPSQPLSSTLTKANEDTFGELI